MSKIKELVRGMQYSLELEAEGRSAREVEQKLKEFLSEPTKERCDCGVELQRLELGAGKCRRCQLSLAKQEDEKQNAQSAVMGRIGVPASYQHCTFATWRGDVPPVVGDYAIKPRGRPLLLFGADTGVGKTHLATACLYSLSLAGHRGFWYSASTLAIDLARDDQRERQLYTKAAAVPVLLIDDLGKESGLAFKATERVVALMYERIANKRALIVTTNMTDEELCDYEPALASRLLAGDVKRMGGEDQRWSEKALTSNEEW